MSKAENLRLLGELTDDLALHAGAPDAFASAQNAASAALAAVIANGREAEAKEATQAE
jgi:hypothetical protein